MSVICYDSISKYNCSFKTLISLKQDSNMSVKISADDTTLWQAKRKVFQYPVTEIGSLADNVLLSTAQPFSEAKAY